MCYAASLRKKEHQIEERFNAEMQIPLLYEPFFYQSGFSHRNLYMIKQNETNTIYPTTWGMIPNDFVANIQSFYNSYNTLNAKSETVFDSKMYKDSIANKRCLIIADGFFEPHDNNGKKYPYFCQYTDTSLFAFAGIYNQVDDDMYSCSILTTKANSFFEEIHNIKKRMPLILDEQFELEWLRNDLNKEHIIELMNVGFTSNEFQAYTISKDIYKANYDANYPDILKEKVYPELKFKQGNLFD